ncbi:MAG: DUF1456 family protein [bacterium]|nr:DUF1456 family protein [bacterium]
MITNDVLRSVRYMLDLSDAHVVSIMKMADVDASREDVASWLKKEDEEGFAECPAVILAHFLDGLVIFKRGKNENPPAEPPKLSVSNNMVLKKLRVAFELKEEDLHKIMETAGFKISKPELSALFRKEGHKNYRPCGDQFLRNFLKGLTLCIRG